MANKTVSVDLVFNVKDGELVSATKRTDALATSTTKASKAAASGGKLYSSSGKSPTSNQTIATFRTQANARGTGYCLLGWFQWLYYQLCSLFVHQNLNFQSNVGRGYVYNTSSAYCAKATGATNTKGHSWGDQTNTNQIKCCFLEDAWGNLWQFCDKIFVDSSYTPLLTTSAANDMGAGYKCFGRGLLTPPASDTVRYIREVVGSSELGFYPSFCNGSESSHFCDGFWQSTNTITVLGGTWYNGAHAGLFALNVSNAPSNANVNIGARLCLKGFLPLFLMMLCASPAFAYPAPWQNIHRNKLLVVLLARKLHSRQTQ